MTLVLLVLWSPAEARPRLDVQELTVAEATRRMEAGALTAVALTDAYLARIAAIDDAGPTLNAVLTLNPKAREDAATLDAERRAGKVRGPLHGIPVLLKDNIDVAGLVTSAGARALADNVAAADAPLVTRLRAAGAIILGKTNLSEWANFRSFPSSSGWSGLGGQTRNPYVLDRNPCGSSSGTGAAIAASLAMVGIGTETDGSILCPSSINGLVGLKPTVGQVSTVGIVPISSTQDTAGPMARTVADAAVVYRVLSDRPLADVAYRAPADRPVTTPGSLQGVRIGVLRGISDTPPHLGPAFDAALATLRSAGAVLTDPVSLPTWGQWDDAELELLEYEFKDGVARYLQGATGAVRTLEGVIAWNTTHPDPWMGQDLLEASLARGPLSDPAYLEARARVRRLAWDEGLAVALRDVDLVVTPSTGPAWRTDPLLGDHFGVAGWGPAAAAGTPSLTVPMGAVAELPIGLTFMGPPASEDRLLTVGAAFEALTHARRAPRFLPTLAP